VRRYAAMLREMGVPVEAEILDDTFARPAGLESPEALILEMAVEGARRQLPAMGLVLEQAEEGTLLRCRTWELGWVARLLAGLDCRFIVRRPAELRGAPEQRAGEISALAKRSEREASS
jgi:hypothetical protein